MASAPVFPDVLRNILSTLTTTATTSIYTAPVNGARIDSLNLTSTDTSARDVSIYITVGVTNYLVGTISVPASAGTTSANAAKSGLGDPNLFLPVNDPYSNKVIIIQGSAQLTMQAPALGAGKVITIVGLAGEF